MICGEQFLSKKTCHDQLTKVAPSLRKRCHKKRPAQRPAEFREEAQRMDDLQLLASSDDFVSVVCLFDEINMLAQKIIIMGGRVVGQSL